MREKKCAVSPKIKLTQEKQHDAGGQHSKSEYETI